MNTVMILRTAARVIVMVQSQAQVDPLFPELEPITINEKHTLTTCTIAVNLNR